MSGSRSFVQMEEGYIFGDSDEDEPQCVPDSYSQSSEEDDDEDLHTPSAATDSSSLSMLTGIMLVWGNQLHTKSKNSKPYPTTRLNVGKGKYIEL